MLVAGVVAFTPAVESGCAAPSALLAATRRAVPRPEDISSARKSGLLALLEFDGFVPETLLVLLVLLLELGALREALLVKRDRDPPSFLIIAGIVGERVEQSCRSFCIDALQLCAARLEQPGLHLVEGPAFVGREHADHLLSRSIPRRPGGRLSTPQARISPSTDR
ncbi:MAG: hypothetical protein AB1938_22525 [Myxococcota bacterium]